MSDVIRSLTQQQPQRQQNSTLFGAVNRQASGGQMAQMAPQVQPVGSPVTQDPVPPWAMPKPPRPPYRMGQGFYDERDWEKALPERRRRLAVPIWREPYKPRVYNPFTPLNGDRPPGWPRPKPVPHTTGTGVTAPPVTRQTPVTGPPTFATGGPVQQREGRWL